jgi:hypothetical protein
MNAYVIYAFALIGAISAPAHSQTHPDFSGVWSLVAIRPAPTAGGAGALPPSDLTIRQTSTQFSTARTAFDQTITLTYDLSGHESTNKSGAVTRVTTAHWDKASLVIEGKASQVTSQGYAAWKFKEIYAFGANGHLLIENEWDGDDGKVTKNVQELAKTGK